MIDEKDQKPVDHPEPQVTNDALEQMIRDPVTYQGRVVSYVKDVGNGDPGFDANVKQVVIGFPGGSEQVVPENEIQRKVQPAGQEGRALDRPSDLPKPLIENPKAT